MTDRTVPVFSFAAFSGTGKTTYLEKLIPALKRRGLRLAVIKDDAHRIEMDKPGKDTWRFTQAGADVVAVTSTEISALIERRRLSVEQMLEHVRDVDLVLTEGYKYGPFPKIGIYRSGSGNALTGEPDSFLALVTDVPLDASVPQFPIDDAEPMAEFLLRRIGAEGDFHGDDME